MIVLSISELTKSFGNEIVLENLALSIEQGKIFALVGPNGAGKTTTINCVADLLDYDKGDIIIFNKDLREDPVDIKKRMGILLENADDLFIYLKAEEHLQLVGEIYGLKKDETKTRIDELFIFFDLNNDRNKMIEEYSKGMKKKLALASILLRKPEFIILDEPFDGLDTLTVVKIKKLIKSLKEKGCTFLITSHILSYIEDISDEVAIINKGKVVYQSNIKDIRKKIKNEVTHETYNSLEEIFIDMTGQQTDDENLLSWL